ncbi:MAG: riboflavin synthase [Verrucomicrobia bacterium]|nr:riboflavin synthase [Verrucomicrobiota bacterium]
MFTGIVEEVGRVISLRPFSGGVRLDLLATTSAGGMRIGDSLAVNGCCLTLVEKRRTGGGCALGFNLLQQTLDCTNLDRLREGDLVNLERAARLGSSMGGHLVSGHIDGLGTITRLEASGKDHVMEIQAPAAVTRLLVPKGSIAVDGISLTVAAVITRGFRVWLIPHTLSATNLSLRKAGDSVNLESDLIGKYVQKLVAPLTQRLPNKPASRRTRRGKRR